MKIPLHIIQLFQKCKFRETFTIFVDLNIMMENTDILNITYPFRCFLFTYGIYISQDQINCTTAFNINIFHDINNNFYHMLITHSLFSPNIKICIEDTKISLSTLMFSSEYNDTNIIMIKDIFILFMKNINILGNFLEIVWPYILKNVKCTINNESVVLQYENKDYNIELVIDQDNIFYINILLKDMKVKGKIKLMIK